MIIDSLDILGNCSKDELLEAALDKRNEVSIQDIALQKWMVLDERQHAESMARMQALLRQSRELLHNSSLEWANIR